MGKRISLNYPLSIRVKSSYLPRINVSSVTHSTQVHLHFSPRSIQNISGAQNRMDSRVKSDTCERSTLTYYGHKTFYQIYLIKYSFICPAHILQKEEQLHTFTFLF